MKKGLLVAFAIAIIFGMVSCECNPIVVSSLKLDKETVPISSEYLNDVKLEVKEIYPVEAANKQVSFSLEDPEMKVSNDLKLEDIIEVSNSGWVRFKTNTDLTNVHIKFNVVAKSVNGVSAKCEFWLNYNAPKSLDIVTYEGNGVVYGNSSNTDIIYLTTHPTGTNDSTTFKFEFDEDEYPYVTLSTVEENDVILISNTDCSITAQNAGKTTLRVTAYALENEIPVTRDYLVYVDEIHTAEELKAFLADNSVLSPTDARVKQLISSEVAYITTSSDILEIGSAIKSGAKVAKTLYLNEHSIKFELGCENTAIDISDGNNLTIVASEDKYIRNESNYDSNLFNVGTKKLVLKNGEYSISGKDATGISVKNGGSVILDNATLCICSTANAVAVDDQGTVELKKSSIKTSGTDTSKAFKVASGATLTATDCEILVNSDKSAVVLENEGITSVCGGSYTINNSKSAVMIDCTNGTFDVDGSKFEIENTPDKVTVFNISATAASIKNAEVHADAKEEAVGINITSGFDANIYVEGSTFDIKSGKNAFGLYNLGCVKLKDIEFSVVGNKTSNEPSFHEEPIYGNGVAGIVNTGRMSVNDNFTVKITNTDIDILTNEDVYGVYNNGFLEFLTSEEESKDTKKVTVDVVVYDGGACALKNESKVIFKGVKADFTAERINEDNNPAQAVVYGLYNTSDYSLGLTLDGSDVTFTAKSYSSTNGIGIGNIEGHVSKKAEIGYGTLTFKPEAE